MRYENLGQGSQYPYPNHDIDPAKKGKDWCMAYAKAAYWDWAFSYPKGIFSNNGGDYEKYRMYALSKQPITQYKKWLGIDELTNNTWMSIDWTPRAIISPYRDRAISKLMRNENGIVATPIDALAKSELDEFINGLKAKMAVRELAEQTNPELAQSPLLAPQSGEPMDIEELNMRLEMGEQFNRSKDAELAIELALFENNFQQVRKMWYEDLFDFGVAGYKEWLGKDNKAKFRRVNPDCVITNFCKDGSFSDLVHAGEVIDVALIDLALVTDEEGNRMFTEQQLAEFASTIAGKFGNPQLTGRGTGWLKPYDKFKCKVLDIEFFSYNDYNYRVATDAYGNTDVRRADYNRGRKATDKYLRKNVKVVYKCKWIVGTEYCYDWGLVTDMKRSLNPKKQSDTRLSYSFYAYNFYNMKAQGFMERLVPYIDAYQLTILKIQNFKNRAVPSGWWIDLDALENIALSKGGASMQPKELLQMFFETGVLVGRSKDAQGNPQSPNWKPVIPIENTAASELAMFYQDLVATLQDIERIVGFNDVTAGNPNPKMLNAGYETATASTNDALFPMAFAERVLCERLAEDVLCRMQQGVRKGRIEGYAPYSSALNANTLTFIEVSPTIATREYGIMLQEKTSDEQKMWLLQQMQQDIANQLLDSSDAVMLVNTHNAKQAQMIWAYKVKKNKQSMQQQELQKIQLNNQGAKEAAMIAQQTDLQKFQLELQSKERIMQMQVMAEIEKEKIRAGVLESTTHQSNLTKILVQDKQNEGKIVTHQIAADAEAFKAHIQGEKQKEKQEIANEKPQSTAKK